MTHDSPHRFSQPQLGDAFLWLVGAPLAILDALYLIHLAPPLSRAQPEALAIWVLGLGALALLAWSLACSACAHLALLRITPPTLRRAAHSLVRRFGTGLSRSLLARAGASALIGSSLVAVAPFAALATPLETATGVSLTWADAPGAADGATPSPAESTGGDHGAPAAPSPNAATQVTVAPGDSLWSIASALSPGADDARITEAWHAIHAENAASIADPSLIYPGQRLTIPQDLP